MSGMWVFGYGSLVSPVSFGHTIGRQPELGRNFHEAELTGYGRRWNYGVMSVVGTLVDADGRRSEWTIVSLGLVASPPEGVNGVVGWVDDDEIGALDLRERSYDRVEVSELVSVDGATVVDPVFTYVPRVEAVRHYEAARDRSAAAITRRYWDLVDAAFADLGPDRRQRYHATTPPPDVPIMELATDRDTGRYRRVT